MTIEMTGLSGTNPIGFLGALGVLAIVERQRPDAAARLSWSTGVVPRARLEGVDDIADLVAVLDDDREQWSDSLLLHGGPTGPPVDDVKVSPEQIRDWFRQAQTAPSRQTDRDLAMLDALIAEGALAGKDDAKPSALHFTAGQQKFLVMARELQRSVGPTDLVEAIVGPWKYESPLPVLGWDAKGERIYALRGFNPSGEKKLGVPGADWLAFNALPFFPVTKNGGRQRDQLLTTGCGGSWKSGSFRWPIWDSFLSANAVRSLVRSPALLEENSAKRRMRSIQRVLRSSIRRSDQGGYGSFGPASDV